MVEIIPIEYKCSGCGEVNHEEYEYKRSVTFGWAVKDCEGHLWNEQQGTFYCCKNKECLHSGKKDWVNKATIYTDYEGNHNVEVEPFNMTEFRKRTQTIKANQY
jgi:hypothetical protein